LIFNGVCEEEALVRVVEISLAWYLGRDRLVIIDIAHLEV
jgi:hypothetical protein